MLVLVPPAPAHASQVPEGLHYSMQAGHAPSLVPRLSSQNLHTLCLFMCPPTAGPGHAEEPPGPGSHQRLDPGRHHRGHQGQEVGGRVGEGQGRLWQVEEQACRGLGAQPSLARAHLAG